MVVVVVGGIVVVVLVVEVDDVPLGACTGLLVCGDFGFSGTTVSSSCSSC